MSDEIQYNDNDGLTELGEYARERRRAATQASERERPEFVEHVEYSEVVYIFSPPQIALPLAQIDPQELSTRVREIYGAELGPLDLAPLMKGRSREEIFGMPEEDILRAILRSSEPSLTFEGGKFPLKNDFVAILSIEASFEAVAARVGGPSQVAETVLSEFVEMMWAAAGVNKRWEELLALRAATAYGTSTRVNMGFKAEDLLHPNLWKFVQEEVVAGNKYAKYMGRQRNDAAQDSDDNVSAMAAIDELHIVVNTFDIATGQHERNMVQFSVMSTANYGKGRLRVTSTMNYDKHVEFLSDLIDSTISSK